jgi:hypothetical protein
MRRSLIFLALAASAGLAAPAAFGAGHAGLVEVDLPVSHARGPVTGAAEGRFTLVGVHWQGPGRILFRTRSAEGRWARWRHAAPEGEDRPDRASRESRLRRGWHVGNPWWVGPSDRIETRAVGRVRRIRAYLVWSPEIRIPLRIPAATGTPPIVPRMSWGADESIRRGPPVYAPSLRFAIVHHTSGRNDYTRADAAAIVKGIQLYHVQANGWNDIGYNFLVDRFGTIYEGRYGGIDKNVVGAHALGFNTGSVGVAVLGTFGSAVPPRAAQDAVARLLAWRLDLAHVDPLGLTTAISGGNERYADGIAVLLRTISGHRDTGFTECPGTGFYSRLDALAARAAAIGGPKIYEPEVEMDDGTARFQATLSEALTWTVTVADPAGVEVAWGGGTGTAVDWTWSWAGLPAGTYAWTMRADTARPATGILTIVSSSAPLAIEELTAEPETITPNGDGQADSSLVSFRLTAPANVTVQVADSSGGVLATVVDRVWTKVGLHSAVVDGAELPDGRHSVVVIARTAAGAEVLAAAPLTVTRTLESVSASPPFFSPNGDGRRDRLVVRFSLAAPASVRVRIVRDGAWVATLLDAYLPAGPQKVVWDGSRRFGSIRDGSYSAVVDASDEVGTASFAVPFVSDTTPPRLRLLGGGRRLELEVSEPVVLRLRIDGVPTRREVKKAGVVRVRSGTAARIRAVAWDAAGNASMPVLWLASKAS